MSSGLTYVTYFDPTSESLPDISPAPVIFSNYDEAYAYAEWVTRAEIIGFWYSHVIAIWTAGPGQNGSFYNVAGVATFRPFD